MPDLHNYLMEAQFRITGYDLLIESGDVVTLENVHIAIADRLVGIVPRIHVYKPSIPPEIATLNDEADRG